MRVIFFIAKLSGYSNRRINAVPFNLLVDEEQYSSFCQYVNDNYPEIRCDDSKLTGELRKLIEKRIREFLNGRPDYTKDDIKFDVDSIMKVSVLDEHVSVDGDHPQDITETHTGILIYEGRQFAFNQRLVYRKETVYSRVVSSASAGVSLLPEKEYHGHSLGDIVEACENALLSEKKARDKEEYLTQLSNWRAYYTSNKNAFLDWFSPLIEANKQGKNCKVFNSEINANGLSKWDLHRLEHGRCSFCGTGCQIIKDPYPDKEHAPQWSELGVEENHCPELPWRIMYWRLR